ncbi:MAG: glutamine--fructose-6-phosphate transaminase (isomerizing), partial [Anaerolineae bacterium]|nr:glutamine--fructose-6-phosphate transaminase (isomerizing) [Anaerolineae bacterium]
MCGIVGYIGPRDATPIILNGLQRLEYRGYDSAGIAVMQHGDIAMRRDVGKLGNLLQLVNESPLNGHIGIGHTRWATHGVPSPRNAHQHLSQTGRTVVVHNGIVENFRELRAELEAEGVKFTSETDTETIVHLVQREIDAGYDVTAATQRSVSRLRGAHAIVVLNADHPDCLVAVRIGNAGGVALGLSAGEMFIASDIPAILEHTRRMVFLESRQMATVTRDAYQIQTIDGDPVDGEIHNIPWDPVSAARGEYRHFMEKEIHEQARALTDTLRGRIDFATGEVTLPDLTLTEGDARRIKRIVTVACGTSAYSGLVGKFILEELTRVPVEVDYGSEYRYRDPIIDEDCAVLAITQSGETVDTLAALEEAREKGAKLWSIVNALGSQAIRVSDGFVTMQAGPEIDVASTKAFTSS